MKKYVKIVAHPTTGLIFTQKMNADNTPKLDKNGKPFGQIRVDAEELSLAFAYSGGAVKRRAAFVSMTVEAWKKSEAALRNGTAIAGQIVREESFTPQYVGQKCKINPTTKAEVLIAGKKVYFKDSYTDNQLAVDHLIKAADFVGIEEELAQTENTIN